MVWRPQRRRAPLLPSLPAAAVSGRIALTSPWAREAISIQEAADLAALVPDGYVLGLVGHRNRTIRAWLVPDTGQRDATGTATWEATVRRPVAAGIAAALRPRDICEFCEKREGEVLVTFEGRVVSCCDTCWQRAEDERPKGDTDDEC